MLPKLFIGWLFLIPCAFLAFSVRSEDEIPTLPAVLVEGEVPGPGLWKATKNGHTIWILGTLQPMPKKVKWRSKQVESLIAQSQEVVTAGRINRDIDVGFIEGVKALPSVRRARRNPDDKVLEQILDEQTFAVWSKVKEKYIGRSRYVENLRPVFALQELREEAYDNLRLSNDSIVWPVVRSAARKHRVKITEPDFDVEVKIEHASQVARSIANLAIDDRDCFRSTIDQFEVEMEIRIARANAWSTGDLPRLTELVIRQAGPSCEQQLRDAMLSSADNDAHASARSFAEMVKSKNEEFQIELRKRWLAAIEIAVEKNQDTFALLPMYDLVSPNGRLALLSESGYEIEAPKVE